MKAECLLNAKAISPQDERVIRQQPLNNLPKVVASSGEADDKLKELDQRYEPRLKALRACSFVENLGFRVS